MVAYSEVYYRQKENCCVNDTLQPLCTVNDTPMTNKNDINKLITSKRLIINNKFLASLSMMDTGVTEKTYCIVVLDLTGNNFKIKYFATESAALDFIQLLYNMKD